MVKQIADELVVALERAVVGRRRELEAALTAFFADGHVIIEGLPGTAKTLMVRTLAAVSGCAFKRLQFTPDLMPADVVGTNVYDPKDGSFRFARGPVFADVVLADEINRAPAKTQSALLECMEERRVTIDGVSHVLPSVFTVFATMNPVEFEGTFPLPEAQLDRFLMKITVGELDAGAEREIIQRFALGFDPWSFMLSEVKPLLDAQKVNALREAVRATTVEPHVQHYLVEVVRRTRTHPAVSVGASTRAAVSLLGASRSRAALLGRDFVIPDDVKFAAPFVLAHRLSVRPEAQLEDVTGSRVIDEILNATPVPRAEGT